MLNLDKQMTRIEHSHTDLTAQFKCQIAELELLKTLVPSPHPSHQPSSINVIVRYMKELEDLTTAIKVSRRSLNPLLLQY